MTPTEEPSNQSVSHSTLLALKGITKRHSPKDNVLQGINLSVKRGEFLTLMGESGSGKSTLLNIIGMIDLPDGGDYIYHNFTVQNLDDETRTKLRCEKIGFVFQFFNLLPGLNIIDNVALPLHLNGVADAEAIAQKKLTLVGLNDIDPNKEIHQLSGGQMQRVAIARAIAHNPELLVADEPTGNLDSSNSKVVLELLTKLRDEADLTVIMATHSNTAASYSDRTLNVVDGRLMQSE